MAEAREIVLRALAGSGARVFLFGSRARGDAYLASDIDIAVLPSRPLPAGLLADLREQLEESALPQTVDLVDLSEADPDFRSRVLAEGIEWRA
ncbi:MAG: nucleotidyltransferase domain-containing protein [Betaproteobacteria bacterium]|nr:nucleotidyltransferase domain-containing protein [Betaproteobacteria bacterium]